MFGYKCRRPILPHPMLTAAIGTFAVIGMVGAYQCIKRKMPTICQKATEIKEDCVNACEKLCDDICNVGTQAMGGTTSAASSTDTNASENQ